MLRLKGRVVYGELEGDWIKFDANQIDGVAGDGIGLRVRSSDRNIFIVDPSTIQPADDKCECPFCGKSWKPFKVELDKEAKL